MSDKSKAKGVSTKIPRLPQVDKILREPSLEILSETVDRRYLAQMVRDELDLLRMELKQSGDSANTENIDEASIAERVESRARDFLESGLRRVINGTGVILNTNLGRAPLPVPVLTDMLDVGQGYSSLEIDVESGRRGERTKKISRLLRLLTGCEAAIVVNNNASAVMLTVAALAPGKEVVVSRSELVEIGGSFRLPDVIISAGGILKEVGTTNKTRAADFERATGDNTGFYLRCHRSNFEISGFTEDASMEELVKIAASKNVPLVEDLGSGAFFDIATFGLKKEQTVKEVIESGVNVVTFSGDKLLGGPQAGIIAGDAELVDRIRKNPMYRALRADKLILSLIENTLSLYLAPAQVMVSSLPVLALSAVPASEIRRRVEQFLQGIDQEVKTGLSLDVVETRSTLGGGSLPGETQESFGLALRNSLLRFPQQLASFCGASQASSGAGGAE
ncbi:MAG: L-seryl-tRNA(Sec) selenium transferase [Cyanobacteriota/Melainabacteria group bacterium]